MRASASWMTMIIIGLVLAIAVITILFVVGGELSRAIFEGSHNFLCQLPFFRC